MRSPKCAPLTGCFNQVLTSWPNTLTVRPKTSHEPLKPPNAPPPDTREAVNPACFLPLLYKAPFIERIFYVQ